MELSTQRRKETGAFYTPKVWADMAVSYFNDFLKEDIGNYTFWDVAGGEGALLEALPDNVKKIGTTLELDDVLIMRSKGIEAYQFNFLDGDLEALPFYKDLDKEKLVIFTNPPYTRLKASHHCRSKTEYENNSAEELFIYRICLEIGPAYLGIFTKAATIQLGEKLFNDTELHNYFRCGFASCSKQGWGLSGVFGVLFSLFKLNDWVPIPSHSNCLNEGKLYYSYWSDNPHNSVDTRTDIENLGQYYRAFRVYLGKN